MATDLTTIDAAIPRFTQAGVAVTTAAAFALGWWPLVAAVAVVLGVTRIAGHRYGLFSQVYLRLVRPRRSGVERREPAAPARFAIAVGSAALSVATVCFLFGADAAGWFITLMVTAVSAFAAATSICVACRIYDGVRS